MGHIYFDDDGGGQPDGAPAPPQLQPPPGSGAVAGAPPAAGPRFAACCARARVDYNAADPCYVFKAVVAPDGGCVAAALSNHALKLFAAAPGGLAHVGDIAAHAGTISDVQFPFAELPHALYSCSRDGTVAGWDLRTRAQAESYRAGNQELYAFAVSDGLVAAGGQGDVHFWDRRSAKRLASFDDMHMDDVTQVRFHAPSRKLLTASQDGLVAVHDLASGLNQDDGFIAALNVGTSVEELGLYGPGETRLWCRTGTETLQLWDWLAATDEAAPGGDMAVADLTEARSMAAAAAAGGSAAGLLGEVGYLVGCHYDAATQQLLLVAGTTGGAVAFWPVAEAAARGGGLPPGANLLQPPAVVLSGVHRDVVRSVECFAGAAAARLLCVSAGEDAQLGLWTLDGETAAAAVASSSKDSADSGGPSRRPAAAQGGSAPARRSPY
ncbi:GTS1 [Scenedesmus sp. PABB004]|nr:GTS1 [Scenedesmus sp. PABB004]